MSGEAVALPLLAVALGLALLGVWQLSTARAQQVTLRGRARIEPEPPLAGRVLGALERWVEHRPGGRRLSLALVTAGVGLRPLAFLALSGAAAVVTFLVLGLLVAKWLAFLGALGAVRACWAWVNYKRGRRRDEFVAQLPELARALSNTAAAGLSVVAGLEVAIGELEEPARSELQLALQEVRIGQSLETAFTHLGERMPSRELGVLISTLAIQQRSGGDLVRALSDMADTLQARKDLIREVRTLMAGSVAVAWIVLAMGPAAILLINTIRPGAVHTMTSTPGGIAVLAVAIALYSLGAVLVRRITRVAV